MASASWLKVSSQSSTRVWTCPNIRYAAWAPAAKRVRPMMISDPLGRDVEQGDEDRRAARPGARSTSGLRWRTQATKDRAEVAGAREGEAEDATSRDGKGVGLDKEVASEEDRQG